MSEGRMRLLLQGGIMLLAAISMAYGVSRGEDTIVLQKAVRVCMECIGLG
ncbi:MAG: thioredoxin [Selenomonas ruminantium]|nr:thioredoxin [Selenomonas ruminantium]